MNDEQPDIIRKVNHNFRLLMKTSGQLDLSGTDLDSALAREVADRSAADVLINERIDNIPAGTTDYNDLENKPSIESVTLSGDKTMLDLGVFVQDDDYAIENTEIDTLWNAST